MQEDLVGDVSYVVRCRNTNIIRKATAKIFLHYSR